MSIESLLAIGSRATTLASLDPARRYGAGSTEGRIAAGGTTGEVDTLERTGTSGSFGLSKDDFLKLFLAQLQNQDPTSPMDNKEMLGQLSQLTMVEALEELQGALKGSQLAQSSTLIGKEITGVDVDGQPVVGVVDRVVQSSDAGLVLMVGEQAVQPSNVLIVNEPQPKTSGA